MAALIRIRGEDGNGRGGCASNDVSMKSCFICFQTLLEGSTSEPHSEIHWDGESWRWSFGESDRCRTQNGEVLREASVASEVQQIGRWKKLIMRSRDAERWFMGSLDGRYAKA